MHFTENGEALATSFPSKINIHIDLQDNIHIDLQDHIHIDLALGALGALGALAFFLGLGREGPPKGPPACKRRSTLDFKNSRLQSSSELSLLVDQLVCWLRDI